MASDSVVRARIDSRTKEKAMVALDAMGLSVSDAIRLLMIRIAQEQKLPFDVKVAKPATAKAIKELEDGKGRRYGGVDELMKDLEI
nr:type II toxin-antitoxin system RelB/DinJ family antitoxin [Mesorhizobium sp.]